jgi:hypothetical protein
VSKENGSSSSLTERGLTSHTMFPNYNHIRLWLVAMNEAGAVLKRKRPDALNCHAVLFTSAYEVRGRGPALKGLNA